MSKRKFPVRGRFSENLTKRFDSELRFFRSWIDKPKALGAVLPTSTVTARKMASLIDIESDLPVLELGPGTGVITKAILERGVAAERLFTIEYTDEFIPQLRRNFPGVNVIHGDAFRLDEQLAKWPDIIFDSVVSAIPLLNFPVAQRVRLLYQLFDRIPPGHPVVQISYGAVSPIPPNCATYSVEPLDWIMRNVPPARLWVYRRFPAA